MQSTTLKIGCRVRPQISHQALDRFSDHASTGDRDPDRKNISGCCVFAQHALKLKIQFDM